MKTKWHPILIGLTLMLVSGIVLGSGCTNQPSVTVISQTRSLEPPFSEIIPSAEYLRVEIHFNPWKTEDFTMHFSDGSIVYNRFIGTEGCFLPPADVGEDRLVVYLSMNINDYQTEKEAIERIQNERQSKLHKQSDQTELYAKMIGLPIEDIAAYTYFWKDPYTVGVQGETKVFFRVGQYLGDYTVHRDNPPELEDGYFLPPDYDFLLAAAVNATITNLRSIITP